MTHTTSVALIMWIRKAQSACWLLQCLECVLGLERVIEKLVSGSWSRDVVDWLDTADTVTHRGA